MNAALLATALVVIAPGIKDAPKKEPAIVGMWLVEKDAVESKLNILTPYSNSRHEFTAEGKWTIFKDTPGLKPSTREFKVDETASPATFDAKIVSTRGKESKVLGIFKVEGDTLTLCFNVNGDRPKSFDKKDGARVTLLVMTRVKKKE